MRSTYPKDRAIREELAKLAMAKYDAYKLKQKLKKDPTATPSDIAIAKADFQSARLAYRQARVEAAYL